MNPRHVIIGASGLVGRELVSILLAKGVAPADMVPVASAGRAVNLGGCAFVLQALDASVFKPNDVVFCCASADIARKWVPRAAAMGCTVIDCSSAFRASEGVPLVVPCLNGALLDAKPSVVAVPNCTTIILLTAISPLRKAFGSRLRAVTVATYQAVSGAGRAGLAALYWNDDEGVFPEGCRGNVFVHESDIDESTGLCEEEAKVETESHRIWGDDSVTITATCMRVPVERVHTEAITLDFDGDVSLEDVLRVLRVSPEVQIVDGPQDGGFPTALKAARGDSVLVGHVRAQAHGGGTRVSLVACGDQLRTGAALSAVRISHRLQHASII
jgi:aspartate-semialdehyde dehydrogenase